MRELKTDKLNVKVYDSRREMGREAAREAAACIKKMLENKASLNIIFAAAPSQNEFLEELRQEPGITWERINGYHMDEYVGLKQGSHASFSRFLDDAVFLKVPFQSVNRLIGDSVSPEAECARYSRLLEENPVDIVFMGIGENGHIAFNDPDTANFHDGQTVKVVELDLACRQQQVNDGCFPSLEAVPVRAYTLTIPALLKATKIFCIVPGGRKAKAVNQALTGSVSEACPASILRTRENVYLYLDQDSAGKLV